MTFDQWWYDWRIKNNLGYTKQRDEIARAAWDAALKSSLYVSREDTLKLLEVIDDTNCPECRGYRCHNITCSVLALCERIRSERDISTHSEKT